MKKNKLTSSYIINFYSRHVQSRLGEQQLLLARCKITQFPRCEVFLARVH